MSYLQWLSPEAQKQFFAKINNTPDASNNTPVDQRVSTVNRTDYPQTLGWPDLKPQSVNWFTLSEEQPWQSWWPWQSWQSSQLQPWQWISLQDLSNITWVKPMSDTELQNQINNDTQKIIPANTFAKKYDALDNTQDKINYIKNLINNWNILKNPSWQVVDLEQSLKNLEASQTSTNTTDTTNDFNSTSNTNWLKTYTPKYNTNNKFSLINNINIIVVIIFILLATQSWFWILVFGLSTLASGFTTLAFIIHFQIFKAVFFWILTMVLGIITSAILNW